METFKFDVNDAAMRHAFLSRFLLETLATLEDNRASRWGKMTAQQMVEHLVWGVELSTGRARTECPIPEADRERMKPFLYSNRLGPREFANPVLVEGLPPLRFAGLAEAKASLRGELDHFLEYAVTISNMRINICCSSI